MVIILKKKWMRYVSLIGKKPPIWPGWSVFLSARDIDAWCLNKCEQMHRGTFNSTERFYILYLNVSPRYINQQLMNLHTFDLCHLIYSIIYCFIITHTFLSYKQLLTKRAQCMTFKHHSMFYVMLFCIQGWTK